MLLLKRRKKKLSGDHLLMSIIFHSFVVITLVNIIHLLHITYSSIFTLSCVSSFHFFGFAAYTLSTFAFIFSVHRRLYISREHLLVD